MTHRLNNRRGMKMTITANQLNQVAELIGTTDKNVVFSVVIKHLVDAGLSVELAFESVFGEGAYKKFSGQVYDALRAKK